jgi:DNA-binding LacI/PurR family transcriptional regulator
MDLHVAVVSHSLLAGFSGLMFSLLRKHLRPGVEIDEFAIVRRDDGDLLRTRMLHLLDARPKPVALIGICLQPDPGTVGEFRTAGIPMVLIDEEADGASTVCSDSFAGGYLAAQHLLDTGRKAIAVVAGQLHGNGSYNAVQRVKGVQKALAERGLPFSTEEVVQVADYSRKDGVAAMSTLLARGRKPDAVFSAAGDICATGLLATARERHLNVPAEMAILGFDDNPLASITDPPLSTMRQPLEEIAGCAWQLATEKHAEILTRPQRILLKPELVRRKTT